MVRNHEEKIVGKGDRKMVRNHERKIVKKRKQEENTTWKTCEKNATGKL